MFENYDDERKIMIAVSATVIISSFIVGSQFVQPSLSQGLIQQRQLVGFNETGNQTANQSALLEIYHPKSLVVIYKMRDIYVNKSTKPISVQLSLNSGTTLIGIWKERKNMWYIFEPGSEKNVIDVLNPRQFDEAIQNKKYSLIW